MIFKLALRNIVGNGWRSLISMVVIAIIFIGMIWMEAMYHSWIALAKTQQKEWEFASGMLRVDEYDPYDAFTWEDSHAPIGPELQSAVELGKAVPMLLSPAVIYPHQRQLSTLVKGIPHDQHVLEFPTQKLAGRVEGYIPCVIGAMMAKTTRLEEGDVFTLRVKDSHGAFNTLDLKLVEIMRIPVPNLDINTIWMDLDALRELKQLPGSATTVVFQDAELATLDVEGFRQITEKEYFSYLDEIMETENFSKYMIYGLIMFLAMIAIFDTQALALFKRRKEIGTFSALGMTKRRIIWLFTVEGALYCVFGIILGALLGLPLFSYFAVRGYVMPEGYEDFGIAGFTYAIKFEYPPGIILSVVFWLLLITLVVSWFAARRISGLKVTEVLKGK
ncbi:MAG: FtsX-like permease family protein [Candidatus Syntrophosphaera sp.]|nr:FtsX-like permease family protein [Candidatus Syntrophosphaera sp.]